jgi:hypothetical protein
MNEINDMMNLVVTQFIGETPEEEDRGRGERDEKEMKGL